MDFKSIKQTVTLNETVFKCKGELPVDEDIIMPDFYPEAVKLLKCKAVARVASKNAVGGSVTVDGHIFINLLFCDKNGCPFGFEHVLPFSKVFESEDDLSGGNIFCEIKTEYLNCRVVTERKIAVHGAFGIFIEVTNKKEHSIIVDVEDSTVQLNRKDLPFLNAVGSAEKNLLIEQELELSAGQQSVDSVLRAEAVPIITEIKAVRNKASVKGNLNISLLYLNGKQCIPYKSTIPFSQFIDIQGINEECTCTSRVQLCYLEVKPRNVDGVCRSLMLNAKLCIYAETYCDGEIPVINDAYSTKYRIDMQQNDMSFKRVMGHINDGFMFKKTFEFSAGSLSNIIDSWTETDVSECIYHQGKINLKGSITVCLLVYDTDSRVSYLEKKCEFSFEKPYDVQSEGELVCIPALEPITSSYTILSDSSIEYRVEYKVNISLQEKRKLRLITDISPNDDEKLLKRNDCSLIVYYAVPGENVWSIAKRYGTDITEMKEINGIEKDVLDENRKLLIPII